MKREFSDCSLLLSCDFLKAPEKTSVMESINRHRTISSVLSYSLMLPKTTWHINDLRSFYWLYDWFLLNVDVFYVVRVRFLRSFPTALPVKFPRNEIETIRNEKHTTTLWKMIVRCKLQYKVINMAKKREKRM